jgi:hypothetical protein
MQAKYQSELQGESKTESQLQTEVQTESQLQTQPQPETETQTQLQTETQTQPQSQALTETQTQPDSQSEMNSEYQQTEPDTSSENTVELPLMNRFKSKKVKKYAYLKKAIMSYDANLKRIKKIKKGIQYYHVKKYKNGYSMIKRGNEVLYAKTKYLTYKSNTKTFVDKNDRLYTYSDMVSDIQKLKKIYPNIFHSEIVGKTPDKRNIYSITLGNPNANNTIFVECSIHAREYTNTHVLMKIIEETCSNYGTGKYKGKKLSDIYNQTKLVILPMVNPDGVSISQFGPKSIRNKKLRNRIVKVGKGRYSHWKANARCVDLNRNFVQGFGHESAKHPSSEEYAGKKPLSEPEAIAEHDTIKSCKPKSIIFVHEAGQVIYYRRKSKLLNVVRTHTHYKLEKEDNVKFGSAADYADKLGITNCTIENGTVPAPLSHWQFYGIYFRSRNLFTDAAMIYMK